MRKIFKKVSAIAVSALMVGMTMGVAAAANYPQPFVAGGAADVAIVYGTGSGVSTLDLVQAGNIQTNLQAYMGASDGSTTVTGGNAWQVGTSADNLELNESIYAAGNTYIGNNELALLSDEDLSNEKGDASYEQFFYFDNQESESVIYTEDDEDNIGLFFKITSGQQIARYVMDFTTDLKSDVESDGELSDIEDKMITFLGKTYTITDASNGSGNKPSFTLMSGALGGTVTEGTPLTVNGYTVEVQVSASTAAQFTITSASGTETSDKMNKGDVEKLANGQYLAVTDISYEGYAEGTQSATFYIGADKIEWTSGSSMTVNGETISDAVVNITATWAGGDIAIQDISINMTAEDDLYVPVGKRLSEATDLDEPEVLVSQNWDIQFAGLEAIDYEDISLKVSGSDKKYTLRYSNYNGDEVVLPLTWSNASGIFGGDDTDNVFLICANGTGSRNITKKDYFLVHTADPKLAANNAKTVLVQYKGADKVTDTNPKARFTINPGSAQYDEEMTLTTTGTFTLKAAGGTFNFFNTTSAASDDFSIALVGNGYGICPSGENKSISNYIRTEFNTLINITDTNASLREQEANEGSGAEAGLAAGAAWTVNITIDDGNRDGDDEAVVTSLVAYATLRNTSTDTSFSYTGNGAWLTDPANSDVQRYTGFYGYEVVSTDSADSPAQLEIKVPKSVVKPLVYVTTAEGVTVTSTAGGATSLGEVLVTDSEVSSVSSKNLIVVGGSCINSVAANLLGSACGSDFTDKTGVGSGQFLIQSLASSYSSSKVALVVAGYEAADTVNAATYLRTQTVDTTTGKKYRGTSATSAELVVA